MSSRNKTDVKKLFEFWCNIKRAHSVGVIVESYPECFQDEKMINDIPAFAFPCEFESDSVQIYSFVLTTEEAKFRFGFCRYDPESDSAMVIITYLPWHETFIRMLRVLAELRRTSGDDFREFITEAYNGGVPDPGGNLKLFYSGGQSHIVFERPLHFQLPSIPQNHNMNLYYNFIDPKNMIAVFAAMLAERRIIFTSRRLDKMSACIQAAHAFLYPMVWQHMFIPVMPMKLKDYLSAPMPYLIGVPEMVLETMTPDELCDVVILNCDTCIFESPFDDVHEMPPEIVSQLKKQLSHSSDHIGDRVSKIFLGVLVQLIGGYRDAVEFRDTIKTFNRDKFIESRPSHLRPFLNKMMELQLFQQFIDERLDMLNTGLGLSDEFELETVRYAEKMKRRGRNYAFVKNIKDKTNPAVKSAVKSVKEGSRGVKTAYKDLKSKFRDITPPNSTNFHSHLASSSQHDRIDGYAAVVNKSSGIGAKHRSAPSSPVSRQRRATDAVARPEFINSSGRTIRRVTPNGFVSSTHSAAHHSNHLVASPTVSPASSLCSSEMNLSQELQNHPLFKSPMVDRSSLRSLQPHHLPMQHSTVSLSSVDTMNDLISLDDSNNTSFDLEDFDPLNQNARPLPIAGAIRAKKSTTLPQNSSAGFISIASVSNPLYPYVTPATHNRPLIPPTTKPPPLPKSVPPAMPPPDDDYELLRKYGLDQFTLTTPEPEGDKSNTNGGVIISTTENRKMSNWTTFD